LGHRDELLNGEIFYSLKVQVLAERWRVDSARQRSGGEMR
jgi:hypothetical protein